MAERQRGPAGGLRSGALLDQLVVKIDVDLSGFRRGIAEAIAQVRTLKGAIAGQVGGAGLGDAMTAALVVPVAVATARIGQMRNELRLLTSEMRNVALLTAGSGAAGRNAGSLVVGSMAGGAILDATQRQGRRANGQFGGMAYRVEGDDLAAAARGGGLGGSEAAAAGGAGAAAGARRGGWFGRLGSWVGGQGSRTVGAFESGRANYPGFGGAMENLGGAAYRAGAAGRGAMGSGLARALGLVGLGSLFSSLIQLAGSLATVISGTLAGAFAALMTPLGLVVAAITALVALFVAANWDTFKEFGEWLGERGKVLLGEGWDDIVRGWENVKNAFQGLWDLIKEGMSDDSGSLMAVLKFFGEAALRILNSLGEAFGALLNIVADVVRALTALLSGDLTGVFENLGDAIGHALEGIRDIFFSWFPEIEEPWNQFWDRIQERVEGFQAWMREHGWGGGGSGGGPAADSRANAALGRSQPKGAFKATGANDNALTQLMAEGQAATPMDGNWLSGLGSVADTVGARIAQMFEGAITGASSFKDSIRSLIAELAQMVLRMAVIEPMARSIADALRGGMGGGGSKGKGGGGNIFGTILSSVFGGFFADGGFLKPGQWGIAGENGPEIIYGGRSGTSVHANDNGGGTRVDARAFINAAGADPAAVARLQAALDRRDRELPYRIRAELGEVQQRRGLRV